MRIAVIGLGKLGSPLAAVLASAGHTVVGVDRNADTVRLLSAGAAPVQEPGLQHLLHASGGQWKLTATTNCADAVRSSDITLVCVPTPSGQDGLFTHDLLLQAVREVGDALRGASSYHVLGVVSTVLPGTTAGSLKSALEDSSQRQAGDDLGLCYTPAFVALGSVVHDLQNPDFILIGEASQDARAGDILDHVYRSLCANRPPVRRMAAVNAEITKLSINTYVTTRISYANMLADLCERLPGADVDVVTEAIGLDARIGAGYLKAAVGYGGPCFPRDNLALSALAHSLGARSDIADATDRVNHYQVDRVLARVREHAAPGATVGILGLTYKPDTPVVDDSFGIALAQRLAACGYRLLVSDPLGLEAAAAVLGSQAQPVSLASCAAAADVLVIATPWAEYARLHHDLLRRSGRRCVVLDCWRVLPRQSLCEVADVVYLGLGASAQGVGGVGSF